MANNSPVKSVAFGGETRYLPPKKDSFESSSKKGLNNYIFEVRSKARLSAEQEKEYGRQIMAGREVEEILDVIQKKQQHDRTIKFAEEAVDFFKETLPDKADKILEMAQNQVANEKIVEFILGNKKPTGFIKSEENINKPIIIKTADLIKSGESLKILDFLVSSIKEKYEIQQKTANVNKYKKNGLFTEQDEKQIQNNIIPEHLQKVIKNSESAQQELILASARIVIPIAAEYKGNMEFADAISEGNIGLLDAAKRYDYTKNNSFYTFAWNNIKGFIRAADYDKSNTIRVPRYLNKPINDYNRAKKQIENETKEPATAQEITEKSNITSDQQEEITRIINLKDMGSLSEPVSVDSDTEMIDFLTEKDQIMPGETFTSRDLYHEMLALLKSASIDTRAAKIIVLRHLEELSTRGIAKFLNNEITRQAIEQIEEKNMKKLKKSLKEAQDARNMPQEQKKKVKKAIQTILKPEEKKALFSEVGYYAPFGDAVITAKGGRQSKKQLEEKQNFIAAVEKLEKAGITLDEVKKSREMPGAKELIKLWNDFFNTEPKLEVV